MGFNDSIKKCFDEAFRQNINETDNQNAVIGTVISVNEDEGTCAIQPIDKNRTIVDNILLSSSSDGKPTYIPTIGTTITVALFDKESGYVAQQGATAKVNINAGTSEYGGLIKIEDLVDRLNKIEEKQNTVIQWLIELVTNYNAHTHTITTPGNPSGPATPLETKTSEPTLTETTREDIENETVTHGNGIANKQSYTQKVVAASQALSLAEANLAEAIAQNYPGKGNMNRAAVIAKLQKIVREKQADYDKLIENPE